MVIHLFRPILRSLYGGEGANISRGSMGSGNAIRPEYMCPGFVYLSFAFFWGSDFLFCFNFFETQSFEEQFVMIETAGSDFLLRRNSF